MIFYILINLYEGNTMVFLNVEVYHKCHIFCFTIFSLKIKKYTCITKCSIVAFRPTMFRPERNKIICICWLYKKNREFQFMISGTILTISKFQQQKSELIFPCTTYIAYIYTNRKSPNILHVRHFLFYI